MKSNYIGQTKSYAEYDRLKNEWRQRNPYATPTEYVAACIRVARDLGL